MAKESDITKYGKYALLETIAGVQLVAEIGLYAGSWVVRPIGMLSLVPSGFVSLVTGNPLPILGSATAVTLGPTLLNQGSNLLSITRKLTHQHASEIWYSIGEAQSINLEEDFLRLSSQTVKLNPIPMEEVKALEDDGWVVVGQSTEEKNKGISV